MPPTPPRIDPRRRDRARSPGLARGNVTSSAPIKISSSVEAAVWEDLRKLSEESHRSISGMLSETIRDYVRRRRIRPEVIQLLSDSMADNRELGRRLAE